MNKSVKKLVKTCEKSEEKNNMRKRRGNTKNSEKQVGKSKKDE